MNAVSDLTNISAVPFAVTFANELSLSTYLKALEQFSEGDETATTL